MEECFADGCNSAEDISYRRYGWQMMEGSSDSTRRDLDMRTRQIWPGTSLERSYRGLRTWGLRAGRIKNILDLGWESSLGHLWDAPVSDLKGATPPTVRKVQTGAHQRTLCVHDTPVVRQE